MLADKIVLSRILSTCERGILTTYNRVCGGGCFRRLLVRIFIVVVTIIFQRYYRSALCHGRSRVSPHEKIVRITTPTQSYMLLACMADYGLFPLLTQLFSVCPHSRPKLSIREGRACSASLNANKTRGYLSVRSIEGATKSLSFTCQEAASDDVMSFGLSCLRARSQDSSSEEQKYEGCNLPPSHMGTNLEIKTMTNYDSSSATSEGGMQ